jgi:hypothetical protein
MLNPPALTVIVTLVIQFLCIVSVHALDNSHLPQERDIYFKHDALTWSDYLHLRPDGTYRKVTRHHLFLEENDRGKWHQDPSGDLILKSDLHYHNIRSESLFISMWHRETLEALPGLRQMIQRFLKKHRSSVFTAAAVERIRYRPLAGNPQVKSGDIMVMGNRNVQRSELGVLLTAIDEFMASTSKNVFVFKPLRYNQDVVFAFNDYIALTQKVIEQELSASPHPANRGDRHGYQEIEASKFNEETKETQPFLFYPELNKKKGGHSAFSKP